MVVSTATAAFAAGSPDYQPRYVHTTKNDKLIVYKDKAKEDKKETLNATLVAVSLQRLKEEDKLILGSGVQGYVTKDDNSTKYFLTSIGPNAITGSKAKTVKLGAKVTKLNRRAFAGAQNLTKIVFTGSAAVTVNKKAFKGLKKSQLKKIKVRVSAKMSAADFEALKAALVACGLNANKIKQAAK
jgi:hypothetical protein